ncbi:DJ-1/PfpI family protein [Methanothermobacter thermautotrophicus]|uniref:DJ-1/PfpI family protein n=1 Tax=Methanothermobacter thermautotrophicus TaxID=145262 RepID=A0A7J4MY11_METTF|nr:DJ-1/PfpI family protein [Methanothermobacter sp.]MDN5374405.1 protease [Methanothermobacter sp.]HIH65493.1 DJ-1/PfpI family protein [Methanothermobacter thermautotrophicus]
MRKYVAVAIIMAGLVLAAAYLSGGGAPVEGRVALVVFEDYNPHEFETLRSTATEVTVIGAGNLTSGYDVRIEDVKPSDIRGYDAVIFTGGSGLYRRVKSGRVDRDLEMAAGIAESASRSGKIIGAICAAPAIPAMAGILRGQNATIYPGLEGVLSENGARYVKGDVVVSGRIVTASTPESAGKLRDTLRDMIRKL